MIVAPLWFWIPESIPKRMEKISSTHCHQPASNTSARMTAWSMVFSISVDHHRWFAQIKEF
jgi:hypothetical protein